MNPLLRSLADTILASELHRDLINSVWLFPAFETLHFMGLTLFFGGLLVVDLRGLGYFRRMSFAAAHQLVPVLLAAFVVVLLSGLGFILTDPERYFVNIAFLTKVVLIIIAGVNAVCFELLVFKPYAAGDVQIENAVRTRIISGLSLCLWVAVLFCGRSIPYVEF